MSERQGPQPLPFERALGARPTAGGTIEFRVWAPNAERVRVLVDDREADLAPAGHGVFEADVPGAPGDDYQYSLDGGEPLPDPCSRWQPEGVRGPSRVLDTSAFEWTDRGWPGLALDSSTVLYELHVGTFSPEGTFAGVIPRLAELHELGVSAIELMPVATFPGERNWGYDGLYLWAAHPVYGGPQGLAELVNAAHDEGLGVVLDVVYNHVGPGAEALAAFGPYFSARYHTPWGDAVNFDDGGSGGVREWAIQGACSWVRDFHVDGLRLDAVHAIYDASARPLTCELTDRVRASTDRGAALIAETDRNDPLTTAPCPAGGQGFDAQWADDLHHAVHALATGERDGYYADFGDLEDVARGLSRPFVFDGGYSSFLDRRRGARIDDPRPTAFVVSAQNHDQVGNRAVGDRLPPAIGRLGAFCTVLSPWVPMLFMGEEYGETRPFQFFTDHIDPEIAEATRQGRRREFASFVGFAEAVPDPQDPETMERSRLSPADGDADTRAFYRSLIALRRGLSPEPPTDAEMDADAETLRVRRGDVLLCLSFAGAPRRLSVDARDVLLDTGGATFVDGTLELPPLSAAALR